MAINYVEMADTCKRMIDENGREITLSKTSAVPPDAAKPWRGPSAQVKTNQVSAKGVFAIPNTSIPTESRGLGFDWVDAELLKRARRVVIVAAQGLPDLESYNILTDGSEDFVLIWGQCLQPGSTKLFYVFGLAQ